MAALQKHGFLFNIKFRGPISPEHVNNAVTSHAETDENFYFPHGRTAIPR